MPLTAINRRSFLMGLLASGCVTGAMRASAADETQEELFHLTARRTGKSYEAVVLDAQGRDHYVVPLKARGHGFAFHPQHRQAVAFARQPGYFAVHFDIDGKREPRVFTMPEGRHFFGHGVFADQGRLIITTENDFDGERSVMGIYDAATLERKGEWDTKGIGAHEVIAMPCGKILCVANGGILTHPDFGRAKLNLESMAPSLVYIAIASGEVVEQVALPPDMHQLSIRHMTVDAYGAVWFGCQYEGAALDDLPLVGRHRRGHPIEMFGATQEIRRGFKQYVGSVTADSSGTLIATSSPVGGCVVFWDAATGDYRGTLPLNDVCGIGRTKKDAEFLVSTGSGGTLSHVSPQNRNVPVVSLRSAPQKNFDNHILSASRKT